MSELNDIVRTLTEEFSKKTRYFECRKIIIWYDYNKEFLDIIDEVKIDNVFIHKLTDDNYFYTKYLLEEENPDKNYLIYTNSVEKEENNWMLDVMLYSESFYADKTSMVMRKLNIDDSLRNEFSKYNRFFSATKRCESFNKIVDKVSERKILELGILATISKVKTLEIEEIVKAIFLKGLNEEENTIYQEIIKYGIVDIFWNYCKLQYGYNLNSNSLSELFKLIVTTALSAYIKEENLYDLKSYIGNSKPNCIVFIDHWINNIRSREIYEKYAEDYEKELGLSNIINKIDIDIIKDLDILKVFDRQIIKYIIMSLESERKDYSYFINLISGRRTKNFYRNYKNIYEALLSYLEMAKLKMEINDNILRKKAIDIISDYSNNLYKFDFYYRKFYLNYDKRPESEILNRLKGFVENLYVNWYLSELGTTWNYELTEEYLSNWKISSVLNQRDFYKEKVKKMIEAGDKVFVIISDALRYEVGDELKNKFNSEVVGSSTIEPMVVSIPSITKLGMASLLPNKEITLNEAGRVFVDGKDSSGLENRKSILRDTFENSIAIDFNNIPKTKTQFNKLLKEYKLVYIYHNVIDAVGDKANTEQETFEAVEKAMDDIMWLRDKITGWLGGVNIFVTADHGFIYQRSSLEEVNKMVKEKIDAIDKNRRSIISKENREIDGLFKFNMEYLSKENKGIYSYIPKSDIRFKVQGGGANYVHGGVTLQEIIVPAIFYKHKRETYKNYIGTQSVPLRLLNNRNKITTNKINLTFFQVESISEKYVSTTYEIYMISDDGTIISNKEKIIADLDNNRAEERNHIITIILKEDRNYNEGENYKLIIRNVDKNKIEKEIPFIIDIAISDEFF